MAEGVISVAQLEKTFQNYMNLESANTSQPSGGTNVSKVLNEIAKKKRQRKKKEAAELTDKPAVEKSSDIGHNLPPPKTHVRKPNKKTIHEGAENQATGFVNQNDENKVMEATPPSSAVRKTKEKKYVPKKPPQQSQEIETSTVQSPQEKQVPIKNQQAQRPKSAPQNYTKKVFKPSTTQNNGKTPEQARQGSLDEIPFKKSSAVGSKEHQHSQEQPLVSPKISKKSTYLPQSGAKAANKNPKQNQNWNKQKNKYQNKESEGKLQSVTTGLTTPLADNSGPLSNEKAQVGASSSSAARKNSAELENIGDKASGYSAPTGNDQEPSDQQNANQPPEDVVRITLTAAPPKKRRDRRERKKEAESKEQEQEEDQNGSDSSSSSSSEEDERPRNHQPLVFDISKKELELFRSSGVFTLQHISPKFPRAMFHCRLCSFHVSSIPEVYRHMKDERHVRLQAQDARRLTASLMPNPPKEIIDMVGQFIQDIYNCSLITEDGLDNRRKAIHILKTMIETSFPGYTIRAYGSFVTELGLQTSNVNVGLVESLPEVKKDGLIIVRLLSWLQTVASTTFRYISNDLNCRTPIIHFHHDLLNVSFAMVADSENPFNTSILLNQYRLIDPRFTVLTIAFRTFARICHLDKPDLGSLPAHAFTLMVLHYMQQENVLPVLHELKASSDEAEYLTAAELFELVEKGQWKAREMSLGQLWLGLVKYYAYSFVYNDKIVCVRYKKPLVRSGKKWGNRRLAIEDPFHTNANMGSIMSNTQIFEFYMECMQNMFHYFWIPQTAQGPLFTELILPRETTGGDQDPLKCTPAQASERMKELAKDSIKWDFQPDKIMRSKRLPVVCTACNIEGHTKLNCTELEVEDVGFIPPPDFNYLALLDKVCWNIFRNFAQRDEDTAKRQRIRDEILYVIEPAYPNAILTMFGSSCNGFGFVDSDLDLCMTFESNFSGEGLDFAAIVKKLGRILMQNRFFGNVMPITSAKVPIVKLRHRPTGLEADISLYNQLGRRNSQLLSTYCAIDPRVRVLGYMTKLLAKQCDIGDASRGSLSSYAYTLMVIHYLQQVKPPVIPVLQEITVDGIEKSQYVVEGWDTWFFENTKELPRVWPHHGANRESPSTLWLGLLLYYANVFDFRLQVVTIRQLKPLYRLEKGWTERPIAIEDPFLLTHNLGSGISARMGCFIRRVFVSARKFFQTPVRSLPPNFTSLEEYLFNPKVLIPNGPPPKERGCRMCGKIGHKVKDCPHSRKKRQANLRNDQQQPPPAARQNQPNLPNHEKIPNPGMNRNLPQAINHGGPVHHPQMNRYRPEGPQMNRQYRPMPTGQRPQQNRYRPAQPVNRAGQGNPAARERVLPSRREVPDPNHPSTA